MAAPAPTALTLWTTRAATSAVLSSGCDAIDALLDGGFRSGLLTELCGAAAAGKTQLCLQLLLQCSLPRALGGLQGTACYIGTEGALSIKRLHALAHVYARRYDHTTGLAVGGKRKRGEVAPAVTASDFLDGIFVEQLHAVDDLLRLVVSSSVRPSVCLYVCLYVAMSVYMSVCLSVVTVHVHIDLHTHTHKNRTIERLVNGGMMTCIGTDSLRNYVVL